MQEIGAHLMSQYTWNNGWKILSSYIKCQHYFVITVGPIITFWILDRSEELPVQLTADHKALTEHIPNQKSCPAYP